RGLEPLRADRTGRAQDGGVVVLLGDHPDLGHPVRGDDTVDPEPLAELVGRTGRARHGPDAGQAVVEVVVLGLLEQEREHHAEDARVRPAARADLVEPASRRSERTAASERLAEKCWYRRAVAPTMSAFHTASTWALMWKSGRWVT